MSRGLSLEPQPSLFRLISPCLLATLLLLPPLPWTQRVPCYVSRIQTKEGLN